MARYPTSAGYGINKSPNHNTRPFNRVIFYKKELLCAIPRVISPRPIAPKLAGSAPGRMANEKWLTVADLGNLHHVMIRNSVNPTANGKQYWLVNRCCEMTMIRPNRGIWRSVTAGVEADKSRPGRHDG